MRIKRKLEKYLMRYVKGVINGGKCIFRVLAFISPAYLTAQFENTFYLGVWCTVCTCYKVVYTPLSNSLTIHQGKTKKITTVKEAWIPGLN